MSLTFLLNGGGEVPLDGSIFGAAVVGAEGLFEAPQQLQIDDYVGRDGGVMLQTRVGPRRVVLSLLLVGNFNVRDLWASMYRMFRQGGALRYDATGRVLRNVQLEAPDRSMTGQDLAHRIDDVTPVSFIALDPLWQAAGKQVALSWGMPTAFDAAIPFDASIPFDGGSSTSVLNVGEVAVPVQVEFTGPLSSATVVAGSRRVSLATELAAGQVLVYRGDPGGQFYPSTQGQVGPFLAGGRVDHSLATADSEPLLLQPGSLHGSASMIVQNVTGDDGGTQIRVLFNERFLTP